MVKWFFLNIGLIGFQGQVTGAEEAPKPSIYHTMIQDEKLPCVNLIKYLTNFSGFLIIIAMMTNFVQGQLSPIDTSSITGLCIGTISTFWTLFTTCFFEKCTNIHYQFLAPLLLFLFLLITGLLELVGEYENIESFTLLTGNHKVSLTGKITAISTLSTSFLVGFFQIIY